MPPIFLVCNYPIPVYLFVQSEQENGGGNNVRIQQILEIFCDIFSASNIGIVMLATARNANSLHPALQLPPLFWCDYILLYIKNHNGICGFVIVYIYAYSTRFEIPAPSSSSREQILSRYLASCGLPHQVNIHGVK